MANLNLDLDFFERLDVRQLTCRHGRGSVVHLLKLKCYAGKHFADHGRLIGHCPSAVESAAEWRGKPGELVAVLLELHFLEKDGDTFYLPNWSEEQGHIAALKAKGKAMAKIRWDRLRHAESNAGSITASNAPTLPTYQSTPNGGVECERVRKLRARLEREP